MVTETLFETKFQFWSLTNKEKSHKGLIIKITAMTIIIITSILIINRDVRIIIICHLMIFFNPIPSWNPTLCRNFVTLQGTSVWKII